jgi:cytidylate kinase
LHIDLDRFVLTVPVWRDLCHTLGMPENLYSHWESPEMRTTRVITIAREYGSGGSQIGHELAARLIWKLLDRELILELAQRAHVLPSAMEEMDEHSSSFIERTVRAFWMGNTYAWSGRRSDIANPDSVAELTASVIREAARLGQCVIVGRGAQCVLQEQDDAFHVFIYCSRRGRLHRIQNRYPTYADGEAALRQFDHDRAAYVRQYYRCRWNDPHLYHLMVNSDLGLDRAVSLILSAAELDEKTASQESRAFSLM